MAKKKIRRKTRKAKKHVERGQQLGIPWGTMERGEMLPYLGTYGGARTNAHRASLRYAPMKFGVVTLDTVTYVTRKH